MDLSVGECQVKGAEPVISDVTLIAKHSCYIIAMYNCCIGIGIQNRQTSVNFQ